MCNLQVRYILVSGGFKYSKMKTTESKCAEPTQVGYCGSQLLSCWDGIPKNGARIIGMSIPNNCATRVDLQDFLVLPIVGMCYTIKMQYFAITEMSAIWCLR